MEMLVEDEIASDDEVPCLLLPIADGQLVLPMAAIAEIIPYRSPQPPPIEQAAPTCTWFLGYLPWRELMVPTLSFEILIGLHAPETGNDSQIAIINNTGVNPKLSFFAMPIAGLPRVSRITPEEISELTNSCPTPYESMHVDINGEKAIIPDIDNLQQTCLEVMGL